MINVTDLTKYFGEKEAVNVAAFSIADGDVLGLVGNNGAGKTTLFRMLLDLLEPNSGKVEYSFHSANGDETSKGEDLLVVNPRESEQWKAHVGSYIDDGFLIDFLTPEEYFDFIGQVSGLTKDQIRERLSQYEKFFAGEILDQKKLIRDFSAGNKQKIGIVSALLTEPEVVILDEPFNFLDPSSQNVLKKLILTYHEEHKATIIISSHNLQHTTEVSTRIALLEHGKIIKDLTNLDAEGHPGSAVAELESYFNIEY